MLRGGTVEGQEGADPFLPLVANLDFDDGIDIANLEDSTMSDWLCNLTPNGITSGPEELLSVTELFGMSGSGLIGAESDHELKSPEKFQDLRFTSTPKSKSTADSGIGEDTSLNKSIEYKVVLNDITDKLKADYFTSLTDVCEYSPSSTKKTQGNVHKTPVKRPMSADENRSLTVDSTPSGLERNVSIIRRRIRTLPSVLPSNLMSRAESFRTNFAVTPQASKRKIRSSKTANAIQPTAVVNCVKCSRPASQSEELEISESEIVYYTGIKKHKSALGIVKFLKIPDGGNLAPFKKIIATLMKLRFAFPYEDLGFRLRAATAEVKNFIRDVSSVMCQSLVDFLPWSEPPTAERTLKKSFYLREFTDEEMKVVILVEDKSQLPICYVSEPFDPSFDAIEIIMATCSNHFIDNDIVCAYVNDTPTFHRVQQMATGPVANLAEGRFNENAVQAFLVRMGEVMTELQSYQITDITKRKSETVIAFDAGVKICSAFVNVNHLADDNLLTYFQQIYARSSQACLNKM